MPRKESTVSTEDIARALGISEAGVRHLVKVGTLTPLDSTLRAHTFGAKWRQEYDKKARERGRPGRNRR